MGRHDDGWRLRRRSRWSSAALVTALLASLAVAGAPQATAAPVVVEVRVGAGVDDAEESGDGDVGLRSSDLELVADAGSSQVVGVRFGSVDVPVGVTVTNAYLQFTADERDSGQTDLLIEAQAGLDPVSFSADDFDVSSRPVITSANAAWSPPPWTDVGESGLAQRSDDLSAVVQAVVDQPGWVSGNAMVFIITGSGVRTAESFNGEEGSAPLLHVEYDQGVNIAPTVSITGPADGSSFSDADVVDFTGSATDTEDGDISSSIGWSSNVSGPLGTGAAVSAQLSLGTHVITATSTDSGGLEHTDTITVNVVVGLGPTADAGPDQVVVDGDGGGSEDVVLDATGSVGGDGAIVSYTWFDAGGALVGVGVSPTVAFGVGSHVVTLEVIDTNSQSDTDTVTITVDPAAPVVVEVRVGAGVDDAEESGDGDVGLGSSDLELVADGSSQVVGVRFGSVDVPVGVTVTNAYLQFTADERDSGQTDLLIEAQAGLDPVSFSADDFDVSSRPVITSANAAWSPPPWTDVGESGLAQRSDDLSAVVQAVVDQPGWVSGNAMVFIITGSGVRTAESFNGEEGSAPLLHVEYDQGVNIAPTVSITGPADGSSFSDADVVDFTGSATDTEDGDLTESLTWTSSLDGPIGNGGSFNTTTLSVGTHIVTAEVTDSGANTGSDAIMVLIDPDDPPANGLEQSSFRIRTDDDVLLDTDGSWAAALNTPGDADMEQRFRIRFEVAETAGEAFSGQFELEYRRNGSPWSGLPVTVDDSTSHAVSEAEVWHSTQYDDGDPTGDLLAGSAMPFAGGFGLEDTVTPQISLDLEHIELEWTVKIRKFYDFGANAAGDIFEFRVVQGDGTPLGTYAAQAVLTLVHPPGLIGGTHVENPNRLGPFADANGNLYYVAEPTEFDQRMMMLKSTDGGATWLEVDAANHPLSDDLESVDIRQVGDTLHLAHDGGQIVYHTFEMSSSTSPDTWGVRDELVASGISQPDQANAIEVLSDGRVRVFYPDSDAMVFKTRSIAGTWDSSPTVLDGENVDWQWVTTVTADAGANLDRIFVFYFENDTGGMYMRTLDADGSLSSRTLIQTLDTGDHHVQPILVPGYWNEAGEDRVVVAYKKVGDALHSVLVSGTSVGPETQVSDQVIDFNRGASRQPVADLAVHDGVAHVLYADAASYDLWTDSSTVGTDTWGTDVEIIDDVRVNWVRGTVFDHAAAHGGGTVYGFAYEDHAGPAGFATGYIRYGEIPVQGPIQLTTADAGPDQVVVDGDGGGSEDVVLDATGSVGGDGAIVSYTWFDAGGALVGVGVSPTVTFGVGSHVVTLEVIDTNSQSDTDTVTITVDPAAPVVVEVRVGAGVDDAEESGDGDVGLGSSDLELVADGSSQVVGVRFGSVDVPVGVTVTNAYLQFTADERDSGQTDLLIEAQAGLDPVSFSADDFDVSSRPVITSANAAWSPPPWTDVGESGLAQRSDDLSAVVQAVVDQPGWVSGNAMVFIITGSGVRTAESFNGEEGSAPLLHVEYDQGVNIAPTVSITGPADGSSFSDADVVDFTGSATDTEDGDISSSIGWSSNVSGPLGTGAAVSAQLSLGTHVITATSTDSGGLEHIDTITVNVDPVSVGGPLYYVSFSGSASVPSVGTVSDKDIVVFDHATGDWSMYFDASDVGITSGDLTAFHVRADGSVLMSFSSNLSVPGLTGGPDGNNVDDSDVFLFTPTSTGSATAGSFSFHFDGSDVGLISSTEDIDALFEFGDGSLGISTLGSASVPGVSGGDEDILQFTGAFGADTTGTWSVYFDGSDLGLTSSDEDLDGISQDGADLVFTTRGSSSDTGSDGEDINRFVGSYGTDTTGTLSLDLDLTVQGIDSSEETDGIHYGG